MKESAHSFWEQEKPEDRKMLENAAEQSAATIAHPSA